MRMIELIASRCYVSNEATTTLIERSHGGDTTLKPEHRMVTEGISMKSFSKFSRVDYTYVCVRVCMYSDSMRRGFFSIYLFPGQGNSIS